MAFFGPSGNSNKFYDEGYKSSLQMPKWLSEMGLDAYEYQFFHSMMLVRFLW